jgi:hypothetical protein
VGSIEETTDRIESYAMTAVCLAARNAFCRLSQ